MTAQALAISYAEKGKNDHGLFDVIDVAGDRHIKELAAKDLSHAQKHDAKNCQSRNTVQEIFDFGVPIIKNGEDGPGGGMLPFYLGFSYHNEFLIKIRREPGPAGLSIVLFGSFSSCFVDQVKKFLTWYALLIHVFDPIIPNWLCAGFTECA